MIRKDLETQSTRQAQCGSRLRAKPGSKMDNLETHFPSLEMGQARERWKPQYRRPSVHALNWAHTCRWTAGQVEFYLCCLEQNSSPCTVALPGSLVPLNLMLVCGYSGGGPPEDQWFISKKPKTRNNFPKFTCTSYIKAALLQTQPPAGTARRRHNLHWNVICFSVLSLTATEAHQVRGQIIAGTVMRDVTSGKFQSFSESQAMVDTMARRQCSEPHAGSKPQPWVWPVGWSWASFL